MARNMARPATGMSVMDAISQRRSVRSYLPERLERDTVHALLAAAVRAPTAVHEEPWAFVVVQDPNALKRLSDRAKPLFLEEVHRAHLDRGGHALDIFASPDFNIFYDAGTLIVICARPMGPFVVADCWLAAENLMLAACSMVLGTCVIGSAVPALNTPEIKSELGIPAALTAIAPIIVGVPSGETPRTARKEPEILYWK
jgi:nitroreductase